MPKSVSKDLQSNQWEFYSFHIEKQCIIDGHEEFDQYTMGPTLVYPYLERRDEATENLEMEDVIRASRVQYVVEEDIWSASM